MVTKVVDTLPEATEDGFDLYVPAYIHKNTAHTHRDRQTHKKL